MLGQLNEITWAKQIQQKWHSQNLICSLPIFFVKRPAPKFYDPMMME